MSTREEALSTLSRPVLLPEATKLSDVADYLGEWDWERREDYPDSVNAGKLGRNVISRFATVSLAGIGGPRRAIQLVPTPATLEVVSHRIVTPDDRLAWKIIAHKDTGLALVILEHGYIIGSHWLAYIDPATIPEP